MRAAIVTVIAVVVAVAPVAAVDFLGVELCTGSTDAAVTLPAGSTLVLESVEIGSNGGLVMLLSSRSGAVMEAVDDLMAGITGRRGAGDGDELKWSDGRLTALAQRVGKKYAALAVSSPDPCRSSAPTAAGTDVAATPETTSPTVASSVPPPPVLDRQSSATEAAAVAAAIGPAPATEPAPEYEVIGAISHQAADATWVDVMGVVANHTPTSHRLATFDVGLHRADGSLICVDTISVSVLKAGQERAFRDAIRCYPGYDHDEVARVELQFAGGL